MPRSPTVYTLPPGTTPQAPNTVIGSAMFNSAMDDVANTFNTVQPVAYGGTGAATVAGALTSLGLVSSTVAAMNNRSSLFVNGSMIDSQEKGNTLGTTNGYFAADQFGMYFTAATAAMSIQRVQTSRSLAGSINKLEYKCTTAKAVLGASDFVTITQPIEGSRPDFVAAGWGAAGAKPFMFRVDQTLPSGLYHIHATNSAGNRHIAVPFTATGSEAVIEVAIPGDTAGTWLTAEGTIGVVIDIVLAAGTTVTGGTASTWGSVTYYAAATQFNILSSTANVALLTDFGLRLDPDATGIYGLYRAGEVDAKYDVERYWERGILQGATNSGAAWSSSAGATLNATFRTRKARSDPTVTPKDSAGTSNRFNNGINLTGSANQSASFGALIGGQNPIGFYSDFGASGAGAGSTFSFVWEANSRLS